MGNLFRRNNNENNENNNNENPVQNPDNPQQRLIEQNNDENNINLLIDHPKIKKTKAYKNPILLKRNTLKLV